MTTLFILSLLLCAFLIVTILYLLGRMKQEQGKLERAHSREAQQRTRIGVLATELDTARAEVKGLNIQLGDEKEAFQRMSEGYDNAVAAHDEKVEQIAELRREVEDLQTANAALSTVETSAPIRKTTRKRTTTLKV